MNKQIKALRERTLLTDEEIKAQLLKSGFLVDYCENLTPEELVWWQDMCKAQQDKIFKYVLKPKTR